MRSRKSVKYGEHTTVTDTETLTAAAAAAPQLLDAAACMLNFTSSHKSPAMAIYSRHCLV